MLLLIIKYFLRFLSFGLVNPLEIVVFLSGANFDVYKKKKNLLWSILTCYKDVPKSGLYDKDFAHE